MPHDSREYPNAPGFKAAGPSEGAAEAIAPRLRFQTMSTPTRRDSHEALPIKVSRTCLAKFIEKTDERRAWLQAQQVRRARRSSELRTPALVRHDKRERQFERALYSNELYRMVDAAVPKHIEGTIREDVVADIIVAVLSEEITTDEIGAKVKKLSAGYFKADRFRNQSLHAPAMHGSTMTIAETVCPDFSEWRC